MTTIENVHGFGANGLDISDSYDAVVGSITIARHFDRLVKNEEVAPFNRYLDDSAIALLQGLPLEPNFTYLDLGCGNGKLLERVRQTFSLDHDHCSGFDVSPEMADIAAVNYPQLHFEVGDMRTVLPEIHDVADLITSINTVHYLPTIQEVSTAYQAAYRLLKPGGWYVIATGDEASTSSWRNLSMDQFRQWIDHGRLPMDWSMPDENDQPVFRLHFYPYLNQEHYQALVETGFDSVEMHRQIPPGHHIEALSKGAYEILTNSPVFVFFIARKPTSQEINH